MTTQPFIFIVDDDQDDLEILSTTLEAEGIKVKTFGGGYEFVSYLNQLKEADMPSLIILDYDMPKINGLQVLVFVMSNHETKDIPVVMYSANKSPLLKKTSLDVGAWEWYTKPFTQREFDEQVLVFKNLAYSVIEAQYSRNKKAERLY